MENLYGDAGSSTRTPKFKSLNGDVPPPLSLNKQNFTGRGFYHHYLHRSKSPIFDPYASSDSCSSDSLNLESPVIRYLRSSSGSGSGGGFLSPLPLRAIENFDIPPSRSPPVFNIPVAVEEDVLVMDGILVDSSNTHTPKSGGGGRMRSPLPSSNSGGKLPPSLLSLMSPGGKENNFCNYKSEKCRSGEDFGTGRSGSQCQFASRKEERHLSHLFNKNKLEAQPCKSYRSGSCTYGSKCRFLHNQVKAAVPSMEALPASKVLPTPTRSVSPIKLGNRAHYGYSFSTTVLESSDWCPLDDGIGVTLPSASSEKTPSKDDVSAHIQTVLYGPSAKNRLPVFTEFCPE